MSTKYMPGEGNRSGPWKPESVAVGDFPRLVELWEDSVRVTHTFLDEKVIRLLRGLVAGQYLYMVKLDCVRDEEGKIAGFSGVSGKKLEMLFVDPAWLGRGAGTCLLEHAREVYGVTEVEVNEQNGPAIEFYEGRGFRLAGRREKDGLGLPYPLLRMVCDGE